MPLITPGYAAEQRALHVAGTGAYGDRGFNWGYLIAGMAAIEHCESILDYGCGKGSLGRALRKLKWPVQSYDPALEQFSAVPVPADLVVSLDVLEHIEPDCLSDVLNHLASLTKKILFVVISTRLAKRFLSDGRNAHLIIQPGEWWRSHFEARGFAVRRVWQTGIPEWVAMMQAPSR